MIKDEFVTLKYKETGAPCILRKSKIRKVQHRTKYSSKIIYDNEREFEVVGCAKDVMDTIKGESTDET